MRRRELQQRRLGELVERLLGAGGLPAERLRAAGVHTGAEVSLDDLAKRLERRAEGAPVPESWNMLV